MGDDVMTEFPDAISPLEELTVRESVPSYFQTHKRAYAFTPITAHQTSIKASVCSQITVKVPNIKFNENSELQYNN
jgi:hypothetical protein